MIQVGDKFTCHWVGHEECYKGRIYQVEGVYRNCTCGKPEWLTGKPEWLTGKPEMPRRSHIHIRAKLIKAPVKYMEGDKGFYFGPLDEDTLRDIDSPEKSWVEIVYQKGDELSLFNQSK